MSIMFEDELFDLRELTKEQIYLNDLIRRLEQEVAFAKRRLELIKNPEWATENDKLYGLF